MSVIRRSMRWLTIADFLDPKQEITIAEDVYVGKRIYIFPFTPVIKCMINSALNPRTSSHSYGLSDRNNELWFVCKSATASHFSLSVQYPSRTSSLKESLRVKKQSNYRPGQALKVPGGWGSQISKQSAHKDGKVFSPTNRPLLHPENIPCTQSVRGWVNPRAIERQMDYVNENFR